MFSQILKAVELHRPYIEFLLRRYGQIGASIILLHGAGLKNDMSKFYPLAHSGVYILGMYILGRVKRLRFN